MKIQAHTSDGDKGLEQRGRSESVAATTSARGFPNKQRLTHTLSCHIQLGFPRSHKIQLEPPEQVMLVGLMEAWSAQGPQTLCRTAQCGAQPAHSVWQRRWVIHVQPFPSLETFLAYGSSQPPLWLTLV